MARTLRKRRKAAKLSQAAEQARNARLRKLRKKYGLGEFSGKPSRRPTAGSKNLLNEFDPFA